MIVTRHNKVQGVYNSNTTYLCLRMLNVAIVIIFVLILTL